MITHSDTQQNSTDWLILRSGKVTASEIDALVTPFAKIRTGEGVKTYLAQKVTELWTGGPLMALQGVFDADQGKFLEERAKPAFTLHTGIEINNVGFLETDDHRAGCSPDAMVSGHTCGVEIKAPRIDTHIRYLLDGQLPAQYVAQVQMSMFVSGAERWHFFSYNRACPPLHLIVPRDPEFQQSLQVALKCFIKTLDAELAKLTALNGGLPFRRALTPMQNREAPEPFTSEIPS